MRYKNEKEILIEQIESLVNRGLGCNNFPIDARLEGSILFDSNMQKLSDDQEIARLFLARLVLIGETDCGGASTQSSSAPVSTSQEVVCKDSVVDEFAKCFNFLVGLRGEKDHGKAIAGLIEVAIFIVTIVTALSSKEASRTHH